MAKFDPTRKRSHNMRALAVKRWGLNPAPEIMDPFARLVAAGESITAAYQALHPDASPSTARAAASSFAAHHEVRRRIILAGPPPRERMAELVPTAFEALLEVLQTGTPAERLRAAAEVLDRGGVPRSKRVETINRRKGLREAYGPLLELAAKLPPRELVRRRPMELPPGGGDQYAPPADTTGEAEPDERRRRVSPPAYSQETFLAKGNTVGDDSRPHILTSTFDPMPSSSSPRRRPQGGVRAGRGPAVETVSVPQGLLLRKRLGAGQHMVFSRVADSRTTPVPECDRQRVYE